MPKRGDKQVIASVKRVRDLMRMDKGLSSELDRLPTLSWLLLLRLIDRDKPDLLHPPYRWRDWACTASLAADDLLRFVAEPEAKRPDGSRGPGLLQYIRSLPDQSPDASVLRECFIDVTCKLRSGKLLAQIAEQLDRVPVASSEDVHALGNLYESMLQEMRDAAGDSGEFYTPRPLTRTLIEILDPKPGESVLDPACGTAGFLVEIPTHFERIGHAEADLEGACRLVGWEAKQLPHLLARMNLLLHGQPGAAIELKNSLAIGKLEDLAREPFDVIATNPPFGGREESSISDRFPAGLRTTETALLFLQIVVAALKKGGRAAVVLPNGSLFASGVAARIRADLFDNCRLTTVLRMPRGCFAPYSTIPTNVLFFTKGKATESVWFYEVLPPDGRSLFTKTRPLVYEDMRGFRRWWRNPHETANAWMVERSAIEADDYNLDIRNPRSATPSTGQDLGAIVRDLLGMGRELVAQLEGVEAQIGTGR
ncbi:MAG TPA: N-6 DNA methylase [Solirubrobacteraceae bacterium]|jgi:type I restriction enzyme M protein|nr:N-6 DNA methylase [Solirubrobacteraceae bacterium]